MATGNPRILIKRKRMVNCRKKMKYFDEGTAQGVIFRRQRNEKGLKLWAYKCPECSWWHLTSRNPHNELETQEK